MLDEATKTRLRQRLEEQRQQLQDELSGQDREVHEMTLDQANENTYSNHMDDVGTHLQEINRIDAVQSNAQDLLTQVEAALQRMDDGTYGLSEVSGKEIPVERLEAIPYATRLVDEEASLEVETLYNKHTPGSIEPGAHM